MDEEQACIRHERRVSELEKAQIIMCQDVKYIKARMDNGLSSTITKVYDLLSALQPKVEENSRWVRKLQDAMYYLGIVGVIGGALGIAWGFLK